MTSAMQLEGHSIMRDGPYPGDTQFQDYEYHHRHHHDAVSTFGPGTVRGTTPNDCYYVPRSTGYEPSVPCGGALESYNSPQEGYPHPFRMHESLSADCYGTSGYGEMMTEQHRYGAYRCFGNDPTDSTGGVSGPGYVDSTGDCSPEGSVPSPASQQYVKSDLGVTPVIYPWMKMSHSAATGEVLIAS